MTDVDAVVAAPALTRAALENATGRDRRTGSRANERFIEFFATNICNRNTRMA